MNPKTLFSFHLAFLIGFFRLVAVGAAQVEQPPLKHDVAVTMKLIQVYVSDKNGRPVRDLDSPEFEVISNGRPQRIVAFERHVLPAEEAGETEAVEIESLIMSRKFFFLFDFAFNDVGGIAMSKKTALDFLDTHALPADEIGILSYSVEKGLTLHEYLTSDRGKIREIVRDLGTGVGLGRAGTFWDELTAEKTAKLDRGASAALAAAARQEFKRAAQAQYQMEILKFSSSLKDFAAGLRYMPGIKHVVLFSKGPPDFLMYQRADQIAPEANRMNLNASDGLNLRLRYESMIRELASSNSPVIAVNVEGLASRVRDMDFEELSRSARPSSQSSSGTALNLVERNMVGDSALIEMARLSGGKYFGGMNDVQKISREIQDLTGTFYVLGFIVPEKWDGKFEKIEVKVKRRGCEVHSQKGYYNRKPFAKLSALEKHLHLVDLALSEKPLFSDPLRFSMSAAAQPSPGGENDLALAAALPILRLRRASGLNRLEAFLLLFDQEKNLAGLNRLELDAAKTSDEAVFCGSFSGVPAGRFECRIVVRNIETGDGAVATSAVDIPRRGEPGFKLFPPLLLAPLEKPRPVFGALPDFHGFDSARFAPLTGEIPQGTKILSVLLPCSFHQYEGGDIVFRAQAVDLASGGRTWLPLSASAYRQIDAVSYLVDLETGGLPAGTYTLYFFAEDPGKRYPSSFVRAPLIIEPADPEP
ncbi:MAG: VWA domain-containing protein [Acidobacteriota bacterium]|nr:VWA domain-containing protein [Acidobacteriota bacterium]HNT30905.1 VWA domain-containing protein [Candidatus Aminicenantes bacterium]MDD8034373.1 VWA domain-containing protein [Acidobacteriota bacterium]MDD8038673.1 VWA domain-containing protein [Acidobacteriota bacterium]MDW3226858.1 VWA domain-containing protein [Acidobacteriota bacterium]